MGDQQQLKSLAKGDKRPVTGGKKPRSAFRFIGPEPEDFAIINFLDSDGRKSEDQEIVPLSWILNGKQPRCWWPQGDDLTRRKLDNLIKSKAAANPATWDTCRIRIMHSGCTYTKAQEMYESLALKSNAEESKHVSGSENEREEDDLSSPQSSPELKRKKMITSDNFKSRVQKSKAKLRSKEKGATENDVSFSFKDDDIYNIDNILDTSFSPLQESTPQSFPRELSKVGVNTVKPGTAVRSLMSSLESGSGPSTSTSVTTSSQYITKGEFLSFQTKLFHKLNVMTQMISDKAPAQRELYKLPDAVSGKVQLPATQIAPLELLDRILNDESILKEMASYLAQLGGRKPSDFLSRSLPIVLQDEVCQFTNWSGSAIPQGTTDIHGEPILREYKKTFANLTNIVKMFCRAAKQILPETTDKTVEDYIKKWLLAYKDRLNPRAHKPNASKSPRKLKQSPRKKDAPK